MDSIGRLALGMISFDAGDPERIQHFIKVHAYAKLIGNMENIPSGIMEILEAAALVHDIGIKVCMEKYGRCDGKLQEQEGPRYAEELLSRLAFTPEVIERVSYLVAHHHTYTNIEGVDYQILVEADFLVNLHERHYSKDTIQTVYNKIFKTSSGRKLCAEMFGLSDK